MRQKIGILQLFLQKYKKGDNDVENDMILDDIVKIFVYISNFDVFLKHYQNYLSNRLLQKKSLNDSGNFSIL